MSSKSFQDLQVWQESFKLAIGVYKLCDSFPVYEQYGLASQMRRSSVSVSSNIAEGFGRKQQKDKGQFYVTANGSLTELENQLLIAEGVGHIPEKTKERFIQQCSLVHKLLVGLQKANNR